MNAGIPRRLVSEAPPGSVQRKSDQPGSPPCRLGRPPARASSVPAPINCTGVIVALASFT